MDDTNRRSQLLAISAAYSGVLHGVTFSSGIILGISADWAHYTSGHLYAFEVLGMAACAVFILTKITIGCVGLFRTKPKSQVRVNKFEILFAFVYSGLFLAEAILTIRFMNGSFPRGCKARVVPDKKSASMCRELRAIIGFSLSNFALTLIVWITLVVRLIRQRRHVKESDSSSG